MKLHYHPNSTFAQRVRIALCEKGLTAELVVVDLFEREQFGDAYRAINPYSRVPTLVDGEFVLFESTAILEYLEAKHSQPALVPSDPRGRATVAMHIKLCDIEFTRYAHKTIRAKRFLPRDKWREDEMADGARKIERHLTILADQLGDADYLVAGRFTLADVCYAPFFQFLHLTGADAPANIAAWGDRVQARESVRSTRPDR